VVRHDCNETTCENWKHLVTGSVAVATSKKALREAIAAGVPWHRERLF